jgi:hypothetical protein
MTNKKGDRVFSDLTQEEKTDIETLQRRMNNESWFRLVLAETAWWALRFERDKLGDYLDLSDDYLKSMEVKLFNSLDDMREHLAKSEWEGTHSKDLKQVLWWENE